MTDCCDIKTVRARKPHRCAWCRETIAVGETYVQASGIHDGEPYRQRLHWDCEIAYGAARDLCECPNGEGCELCDLGYYRRERGTIVDDEGVMTIVQAYMRIDAARARRAR